MAIDSGNLLSENKPYTRMKVILGFLSGVYLFALLAQAIGESFYIYWSFGYYYYTYGVVVNACLSVLQMATPGLVVSICGAKDSTTAASYSKCLWCALFGTLPFLLGGLAAYIVLWGYVSPSADDEGMCVIISISLLGLDIIVLYVIGCVGLRLASLIKQYAAPALEGISVPPPSPVSEAGGAAALLAPRTSP